MNTEIVRLPMSLNDLSHDLRTPLTGILGMAKELEEETLTPKQKSFVRDITEASMNLLKLANRLSETQRLESIKEDNLQTLTELLASQH